MKQLSIAMWFVVSFVVVGVLCGGCEKTSDLEAMKQEALGITGHFKQRFDDLDRRGAALDQRSKAVPSTTPEAQIARATYDQAVNKLTIEIKPAVANAPKAINDAANTGDRDKLRRLMMKDIQERFDLAYTELNAKLDAYDNWLTHAETVASGPRTAPAPTPTPPTTPTPEPGQPSIMPVGEPQIRPPG